MLHPDNAVRHILTGTCDTEKLVNFKKWFTGKRPEHHPEFFANDSFRCPEYVCKIAWISLDIYFHPIFVIMA